MITRLIIDGVLKIAQIVRYEHQKTRVAKVFDPRGAVPERVLDEVQENIFLDREYDKKYILTPLGMSPVL